MFQSDLLNKYFFNLDDICQKRALVVFIEAHSWLHFTAAKESGRFGTRGPSKNTINYEAIYMCFSSKKNLPKYDCRVLIRTLISLQNKIQDIQL